MAVYTSWNEGITKVQQIVLINGIAVTAIRAICCSLIWNVWFVHIYSRLYYWFLIFYRSNLYLFGNGQV